MPHVEEITKAIAAHGFWKQKLLDALQGGSGACEPGNTHDDKGCDFGRWFHALPAAVQQGTRWREIKALHAEFHRAAADTLSLCRSGRKDEAQAMLGVSGRFTAASSKLTMAMIAWKKDGG